MQVLKAGVLYFAAVFGAGFMVHHSQRTSIPAENTNF